MDIATARRMSDLTTEFYRLTATSFSATRQSAWPGWSRALGETDLACDDGLGLLDLACGNLRFERFLARKCRVERVWAVDCCDDLVGEGMSALKMESPTTSVSYQHLDVVGSMLAGDLLGHILFAPACDLAVAFGFLHHVPTGAMRLEVLRAMLEHVRPAGYAIVSLWQFARSERIMARAVTVEGGDEGDYLLGWQDRKDVSRYCHSFSEQEVDELVAGVAGLGCEVARFSADGKTGNLNRYLVVRRDA